jgi:hypothetical protein
MLLDIFTNKPLIQLRVGLCYLTVNLCCSSIANAASRWCRAVCVLITTLTKRSASFDARCLIRCPVAHSKPQITGHVARIRPMKPSGVRFRLHKQFVWGIRFLFLYIATISCGKEQDTELTVECLGMKRAHVT